MSGGVKRATRVAERIREELSAGVRSLRDPRANGVLISRVEITDDLQLAKVYVRHALGADDPTARRAMLKGLSSAMGRLRHGLAGGLGLRVVPELRFYYDEGPDARRRIEEVLEEIKAERREP